MTSVPRQKKWAFVRGLIALSCTFILSNQITDAADPIPSDFKVVAKFNAGPTSSVEWETTISANGSASTKYIDIETIENVVREKQVDRKSMGRLLKIVEESEFGAIPKEITGQGEDRPTVSLTVTLRTVTRKVTIYSPKSVPQADKDFVKKFDAIWSVILELVPLPEELL